MAWIERLTKYGLERGIALENTMKNGRDKLGKGTYKADDYVNDSLKLWVDAVDGWIGLFPSAVVEPTPTLFTTVAAGASTYDGFVAISPLPGGATPKPTTLIGLNGGAGTGVVATAVQSDGTLKFSVSGLASLKKDDLYESICYYVDAAGNDHLVAVLRMLVV